MSHYLYIVKCSDDSFYTGITGDWRKRIREHEAGKGSLHTKCRLPVKLVYLKRLKTHREAALREKRIKGWTRKRKQWLIRTYRDKINAARLAEQIIVYPERTFVREGRV